MLKHLYVLSILILVSACGTNDDSGSQTTPRTYHTTDAITVDGLLRTYTVNLPPSYYTSADFALVIAMHGGGGSAEQFEASTLLSEKANEAGFIVVYPDGVKSTGPLGARTWNAGACCEYARDNNIDDVNFIRQLIAKLLTHFNISPKKVYLTGHSNGGMLSYRLACEMSSQIAAIAVSSCSMVTECDPANPVPVLHMHSKRDTQVPYQGGTGITNVYFPPVESVIDTWSSFNGCGSATRTQGNLYTLTEWKSCLGNASVQWYLTEDGGHAWPGGLPGSAIGDKPSTAINANDLLWDFFKAHPIP